MKKIVISLLSILVLLTPTYVFAEEEELTLPSASQEPTTSPEPSPTPTPTPTPEATPEPTPTPEVKKDPTYRLKNVKITGAEFIKPNEFKSTEYDYKIKITDQSKFKIEAVASDEGGSVSYNIDTDNINIDFIKRNGIKIWVTVDGKTNDQRIYEFKLEEEVLSSKLSKLELEGGNYPFNEKFDKDTLRYTVSIPNEVDTITINAVAEEKDAQITISPEKTTDLKVGINNFKITVKNSGSTTTYTLVVTREEKEEVEEKETSIISTTSSDLTTTTNDKDFKEPDNPDSTFNMIIVTLGCLFLITIGGIGIYFFIKTSPKRMKKELIKERTTKKENHSPMFEVKEEKKLEDNKQKITSNADNIIENLEDTKEFKN